MFSITAEEAKACVSKFNRIEFKSNLGFLMEHGGFKKGKMHTFLGVAGGGKSTLRNSILIDVALNNPDKKILLWLSEESVKDFKIDASRNYDIYKHIKNLEVFSEQDNLDIFNDRNDHLILRAKVESEEYDLVLIDNSSTSIMWGQSPKDQANYYRKLKGLAINSGCCMVTFNHTQKNVKKYRSTQIDQSEFKGSSAIEALTEFLYVLQSFKTESSIITTIKICKNRHIPINNDIFSLKFNKERVIYDQCVSTTMSEISEWLKLQKKLGFSST